MDKMLYVSDAVRSTYAGFSDAVSNVSRLLQEDKVYCVCCRSLPLTLAAMYAVSERSCKAVLIETGAGDGYVSGIMDRTSSCAVITDDSELCRNRAIYVSYNTLPQSENAQCSFIPPDIIYPYTAPDGTEKLCVYDRRYLSDIAELIVKKLSCDLTETFICGISGAMYGISLAFAVISEGGCIYEDIRPENATCAVMALSAAGSSSINKCLKAAHIITYGAGSSEKLLEIADHSEKSGVKYYVLLGYPVFSFVTKACANSREVHHIGKPISGVSACIADENGRPAIQGGSGFVYVNAADDIKGDTVINGVKMRSTGMKGHIENGKMIVFTDSQYLIYRNRYYNAEFISRLLGDTADIEFYRFELHEGRIYAVCLFKGSAEQLCRILCDVLPGWYREIRFVNSTGKAPREMIDIMNADKLRRYIASEKNINIEAVFDGSGALELIIDDADDINETIDRFMAENCPEIRTQIFIIRTGDKKEVYEYTASEKEMTEDEAAILEIWRSVLDRPALSRHDNFIDNGGTSFELIKGFYRIKQMIGRDISVSECVTMDTPEKTFALLQKNVDDKELGIISEEQLFAVCLEMQTFPDEDELMLPVSNGGMTYMIYVRDIRLAAENNSGQFSFMPYELWRMALDEYISSADKCLCSVLKNADSPDELKKALKRYADNQPPEKTVCCEDMDKLMGIIFK